MIDDRLREWATPNCGIYVITSLSGNQYVGQSVNISHRKRQHLSDLRLKKHHSVQLQKVFDKYGEAGLRFEIWCNCRSEHLPEMEILAEQELRPKYNSIPCGETAPMRGRTHTPEARAKLSLAHTGRKLPMEQRERMSAAMKGREKSREHLAKIGAALTGKKFSPERRAAMVLAFKGRTMGASVRGRMIKNPEQVICVETGAIYANAADAAREFGARSDKVLNVCKGIKKTAYGFHWEFVA